ncbi:hypothetical protein BDV33DRAFT_210504 [Aspergillus novoparasiticus]|uniref:Uncharacterized protein n=1 Tax=Aspergillus novoparasiticus TaxID=986946 RepID=A0A5N6E8M7_9EURO|nr:hypothetical protein BDV33DRAFT_210504 [Aspergillus novoparasiticus]
MRYSEAQLRSKLKWGITKVSRKSRRPRRCGSNDVRYHSDTKQSREPRKDPSPKDPSSAVPAVQPSSKDTSDDTTHQQQEGSADGLYHGETVSSTTPVANNTYWHNAWSGHVEVQDMYYSTTISNSDRHPCCADIRHHPPAEDSRGMVDSIPPNASTLRPVYPWVTPSIPPGPPLQSSTSQTAPSLSNGQEMPHMIWPVVCRCQILPDSTMVQRTSLAPTGTEHLL